MKNINLIYNSKGFLEEQYEDGDFYIAKEEDKALTFKATFPASLVGSVRAYLQFRGGGDVVECGNININSHTIECAVDAKYLSYNFLKIGFEVITATKEIRFEPVTVEVDEFVNVGGKSSAEGYTVTVKVGNVTKLAPGEEPYVRNVGTSKDAVFDFGIPKGDKPEKGVDYYTEEEKETFKSEVLSEAKETFAETFEPKNILNDDTSTLGYMVLDGVIGSSSILKYTEHIPVKEGDVIRSYIQPDVYSSAIKLYSCRFFTAFSGENVVSSKGKENSNTYTVPSGVDSIVISYIPQIIMITKNFKAAEYEEYFEPYNLIKPSVLPIAKETTIGGIKAWITEENGEKILNLSTEV